VTAGLPDTPTDAGVGKSAIDEDTSVVPVAGEHCETSLADRLTHAELQVILWMSRGLTTPRQLGQRLFRSPNTVRTQLNSIYSKLEIHRRDEVVAWFHRQRLADELDSNAL